MALAQDGYRARGIEAVRCASPCSSGVLRPASLRGGMAAVPRRESAAITLAAEKFRLTARDAQALQERDAVAELRVCRFEQTDRKIVEPQPHQLAQWIEWWKCRLRRGRRGDPDDRGKIVDTSVSTSRVRGFRAACCCR